MFDSFAPPVRPPGPDPDVPYPRRVPLSAHDVAAELRSRHPGMGTVKVHKLLYLCQGYHLATFGIPLFDETISAWDNGPVVGKLWWAEDRNITPPPATRPPTEAELNTVGYVLSRYGALSGRDLIRLTHSEDPWRRADEERSPGGTVPINIDWLQEYFTADSSEAEVPLDSGQVRQWLSDATERRDVESPRDDPGEIIRRIQELGGRSG